VSLFVANGTVTGTLVSVNGANPLMRQSGAVIDDTAGLVMSSKDTLLSDANEPVLQWS